MKKERINFFIIVLLFIIVICMFSSVSAYTFFDKYMLYTFLFFDLFLLLLNSKGSFKKNNKLVLLGIALSVMLLSLAISFGGIGSFLCIINFITQIYLSKINLVSEKSIKYLYFLIIIFYLLSAVVSYGVWNKYLYGLKAINPNTIAIVLLYTLIMLAAIIERSKLKHKKLLIIAISAITIVFILNCHCRNALIALLLFLIIILLPGMKKFISSHIGSILALITIIGIIIPYLYSQRAFGEIEFLNQVSNKSIYTGRDIIWKNMILSLSEKKYGYLIGLGSHNITKLGIIVNYHTWYLGIVYMYGIPVFFVYFYYLIDRIKKVNNSIIKIGFLAIFITGIFETSAIWINLQFLVFILLLLNRKYEENDYEKTNNIYTNIQ